jgi:hypothetical protein
VGTYLAAGGVIVAIGLGGWALVTAYGAKAIAAKALHLATLALAAGNKDSNYNNESTDDENQ